MSDNFLAPGVVVNFTKPGERLTHTFKKMRIGRTYVYERKISRDRLFTYGFLGALCLAGALYTGYSAYEAVSKYRDVKKSLALLDVRSAAQMLPHNNGNVVHVQIPQSDLVQEHTVQDAAFGVSVPGAVTLERRVEYCQWREHVHERTVKTGNDKERVERTYTYTKGWTSSPINSLFFDQPAAHHNPQRRPVAAGFVDSTGVRSTNGFTISAEMMGSLSTPTVRIRFRPESLRDFVVSPAATNEKFFYAPDNSGWFVSKYSPSVAEMGIKAMFQYLEGTLLDFQLGDLFSTCDAGDVRVALEGKLLRNGVSAIALQQQDGSLVPFRTLGGRQLILLEEGQHSSPGMIRDFTRGARNSALLSSLLAVACVALTSLMGWLFYGAWVQKKRAEQEQKNKNE